MNNIFKGLIMLISLVSLAGCSLQDKLLYYPSRDLPSREELAAGNIEFWPVPGTLYRGFIGRTGSTGVKGTVIVFHGNAGTAADRVFYVQALAPLGYRVILAEYPGYGARGGALGEISFVRDAAETLRLAYEQNTGPIFLLGESLGCGVAAALGREYPEKIAGIILFTPWDTLASVAKAKFPFLPTRLFLKDRYDNMENLKGFPGKIALIGAERDEIIPIRHALKLYESLPVEKRLWIVKGAGHNDWPLLMGVHQWQEFMDYVATANRR
ncbi:MAG: alpha/beta fold hydrolase [Smithellaceae bacterium]|nr:alpha/beta fold hydrolase [Smithellaceae bacterium]